MYTHIYKYVSSILITFLLQFVESAFTIRTFKSYSHQCNLIENVSELSNHYSTVFGINFRSPLESLSYFSVADASLIPDIMHDVLEGALPLEMKCMLKVCVIK